MEFSVYCFCECHLWNNTVGPTTSFRIGKERVGITKTVLVFMFALD